MSVSAQQQKVRRIVWTAAIAAVTATGTLYGAGLKIKTDTKKAVQKSYEATPAEQIAILEDRRSTLIGKKLGLEKKIREIEMREGGATREQSLEGMERKRGR